MPPLAILMLHSVLLGGLAAAATNAVWLLTTGHTASIMTTVVITEAVLIMASAARELRARKETAALEAAYEMPTLGEDFEPPHRPPANPEKP